VAADPPDPPVVLEPQVFAFAVSLKFLKVPFSSANGAKVTSYKVIRCRIDKPDECVTFTSLEHHFVDSGNALEYTDEKNVAVPLLANTGYSYKISAKNKAGYSLEAVKQVKTMKHTPSHARLCPKNDLKTKINKMHQYDSTIYWNMPQYSNGWDIEGYNIKVYKVVDVGAGCHLQNPLSTKLDLYINTNKLSNPLDATVSFDYEYTIHDLQPGGIFCVSIRAKNKLGYSLSTLSSTVSIFTGKAPPSPICNITYKGSSLSPRQRRTQLKIGFQSPHNNQAKISNYSIAIREQQFSSFTLIATISIGEVGYVVSHLKSSENWKFQGSTVYELDLRATNSEGTSLCCNYPNCSFYNIATDPADVPNRVTNVNITTIWGTGFNISWNEPYDGDASIEKYLIQTTKKNCASSCIKTNTIVRQPNNYFEGGVIQHFTNYLRANTDYTTSIVAMNKVGCSRDLS